MVRIRLFRRRRVQVSGWRAMLTRLEPTGAVGIEDFGRLTTRRIKLVGTPGVHSDSTVAPAQGGRRQQGDRWCKSKFPPAFSTHRWLLARYSWKRTPEGALDP